MDSSTIMKFFSKTKFSGMQGQQYVKDTILCHLCYLAALSAWDVFIDRRYISFRLNNKQCIFQRFSAEFYKSEFLHKYHNTNALLFRKK